jgi:hypothetical protein
VFVVGLDLEEMKKHKKKTQKQQTICVTTQYNRLCREEFKPGKQNKQ